MTDYFARLAEPRRPWLDPETLKQKFLRLSAEVHPDRVHHLGPAQSAAAQQHYVELNSAYQCLREPKDRLRHLLELELGSARADIQAVPVDLADLFVQIGQSCRDADKILSEKSATTSPLLRVRWFEQSQAAIESLQALQRQVAGRRERLIPEVKDLDAKWVAAMAAGGVDRLEITRRLDEIYRLFSYFDRWIGQLGERVLQLSF
jgi:curved DNA-binding protein CbpA